MKKIKARTTTNDIDGVDDVNKKNTKKVAMGALRLHVMDQRSATSSDYQPPNGDWKSATADDHQPPGRLPDAGNGLYAHPHTLKHDMH